MSNRSGEATTPTRIGDEFVVTATAPVAGGQCIARADGQVVFVRGTIPGETVRVRVTGVGRKGSFVRADAVEVLAPSPHRVTPPCALADECGGCDWQHVDLAFQRDIKRQVICDAFRRTGRIDSIGGVDIDDAITVAAVDDGDGLGWRTRMRYAVTENGEVGLRAGRSHRIIPAAACPLAVTEIRTALSDFSPPQNTDTVVVSASGDGSVNTIPLSGPARPQRRPPRRRPGQSKPAPAASPTVDAPVVTETVAGRDFQVSSAGFWQVHPRAAETLCAATLAAADLLPGDHVLDLYSGVGLFACFMAEQVTVTGRVDAVEGDRIATDLARVNSADTPWVHHHNADVNKWLAGGHRTSADVVVLDPPRAGAGAAVVGHIVARNPRRIVYIACDAVSLARDSADLTASGYRLAHVQAFDIFPMTKHVECVAVFVKD